MAEFCSYIYIFIICCEIHQPVSSLPGLQKLWRSWPNPSSPVLSSKELSITGIVGGQISLPCKVKNLEDKTISWIREKDLNVLAVDTTTYTGDQRFSVKHELDSEDWWLQLKNISRSDEGIYDCQINTYPKVSTKIYLKVVTKQAESSYFDVPISDTDVTSSGGGAWREMSEDLVQTKEEESPFWVTLKIKGRRWVTVSVGKTLQLVCEATRKGGSLGPAGSTPRVMEERILRWTLDDVPVEILFPEWKVNIEETWTSSGIQSDFRLHSVISVDAGEISCIAPHAVPASVTFDVDDRKSPKQHYPGLSNAVIKEDHVQMPFPVTSAVSGASIKKSNSKFAVLCAAILILFTLTNVAVCFHYFRKS